MLFYTKVQLSKEGMKVKKLISTPNMFVKKKKKFESLLIIAQFC